MIIINKVVKNASWIIGVKIFQTILTLFVTMITARYLGPSNYGLINYAAAIVSFFSPIALLGLNETIVQELINNSNEEDEIIGSSIIISIICSLFCMIGIAAFAEIANPNEMETIIVCILYSTLLIFQSINLMQYWFQAHYLSKYSSIASVIAYVLVSVFKIYLLIENKSIYWFAVSSTIENAIISILLVFLYKKISNNNLKFNIERTKKLIIKSSNYILPNIMIVIFSQTDRIMLKMFINEAATGYYSAAHTCAGIGGFVMSAIIDSMRPSIYESKLVSEDLFEKRLKQLFCIIIYISVLKNIFICIFAKPIVLIVYGNKFINSISTLRWICWYITFSEIGVIRNIWILSNGQQKWLSLINIIGAIANILLNIVLINSLGIVGAAIATVLTQFIANVIITYLIKPIRPCLRIMIESLNIKNLFGR